MSLVSGFVEEARRLGARLPPVVKSPLGAASLLAGGLAAYDLTRGLALHQAVGPEDVSGKSTGTTVDAAKYVAKLLKTVKTDKPVVIVTSKEGVEEMLGDSKFSVLHRLMLRAAARKIVEQGTNAAALKGNDKFYIIVPPRVSARVIEHELGHLTDDTAPSSLLTRLLSIIIKPVHERTTMAREKQAWEATKDTPLKAKALDTYESGFHRRRGTLAGRLAASFAILHALGGEQDAGGLR